MILFLWHRDKFVFRQEGVNIFPSARFPRLAIHEKYHQFPTRRVEIPIWIYFIFIFLFLF